MFAVISYSIWLGVDAESWTISMCGSAMIAHNNWDTIALDDVTWTEKSKWWCLLYQGLQYSTFTIRCRAGVSSGGEYVLCCTASIHNTGRASSHGLIYIYIHSCNCWIWAEFQEGQSTRTKHKWIMRICHFPEMMLAMLFHFLGKQLQYSQTHSWSIMSPAGTW